MAAGHGRVAPPCGWTDRHSAPCGSVATYTYGNVCGGGAALVVKRHDARWPLALRRRVAVCGGRALCTPLSPGAQSRPPFPPLHPEWRCIRGGAVAVAAAITATVAAAGTAARRRRRRGARHESRRVAGGRASAVPACLVVFASL